MISLSDIKRIGKSVRSKPPMILGNCDYISKEFRNKIINMNDNIGRNDIVLPVVHVIDYEGRKYTDGHTIIKINSNLFKNYNKSEFVYIDLSLDQFCEQNFQNVDLINISFGSRDSIENVHILDQSQANQKYNFTGKQL